MYAWLHNRGVTGGVGDVGMSDAAAASDAAASAAGTSVAAASAAVAARKSRADSFIVAQTILSLG